MVSCLNILVLVYYDVLFERFIFIIELNNNEFKVYLDFVLYLLYFLLKVVF